ncbi:hypothetical protein PRIPAC_88104 [Pristionchus pacificus]|nr:hypothetical protein PRIPAC_88104 [Pristionchus pacificus]
MLLSFCRSFFSVFPPKIVCNCAHLAHFHAYT